MGKTTNILDLNNRLEKIEKENVAQNNYNSLKNRPKINGNLLTGDKTGTQLGLANAQDIGNLSDLTTTDKNSCVGAISEINNSMVKCSLVQCELTAIQANTLTLLHTLSNTENYELLGALPFKVVDNLDADITHQIQLFIKGTHTKGIYGLVDHAGNYKVLAAVFFKNKEV